MVRAAAAQNSEHPPVSLALVAIAKARLKNCNLHQLARLSSSDFVPLKFIEVIACEEMRKVGYESADS